MDISKECCIEVSFKQPEMTTMEYPPGIEHRDEPEEPIAPDIFEPFAQEQPGSRTKFAGTGLGMAISKKLVEKMGGTITFESEKGKELDSNVPFRI